MPYQTPLALIEPLPVQLAGEKLRPVLGLFSAASIVVGGTIGSGVFLKPHDIAASFVAASASPSDAQKYVPLILFLWVACGLVNLCGALTLAELSTMMPQAGGNYIYLREAYGKLWAFLWGWAEFWVVRSGSSAALAAAMAIIFKGLIEQLGYAIGPPWQRAYDVGFPIAIIVMLTVINIVGTRWGGAVQNITTLIKAGFVLFLAVLPFLATGTEPIQPALAGSLKTGSLLAAIGISLAGIMWAYDGWGMVTVIAEEIKEPQKNVPRALFGGVVFLTLLYFGANLAYHQTMAVETLARIENPAVELTRSAFGGLSGKLMSAMMMISVFGALNSNILVGPRVFFAVARDHRFLAWMRRVDPRFGTPSLAIAAAATWACVLVVLGFVWTLVQERMIADAESRKSLFDVMTLFTVFGGSLFYFAAVLAVFVLRKKQPDAPRPYRTWGYPWVPSVFVLFYIFLLLTMLWGRPVESISGLLLILTGAVFYALMIRWRGESPV